MLFRSEISTSSQKFIALRGLSTNQCVDYSTSDLAISAWREKDFAVDFVASDFVVGDLRHGSAEEFELARVMAKWPKMGTDMNDESMPAETGLTDCAVSFTKGCYPGQELVERMDSRGAKAPQQLRLIRAHRDARAGEPVVLGGQTIGIYTSVCQELALALIKRWADSSSLEIGP